MKIELKKLVRKGPLWEAQVWVDGVRMGPVGRHENGRPYQAIERGTLAGINAWLANNATPTDPDQEFHDLMSWSDEQIALNNVAT